MTLREASHAGSWYSSSGSKLSKELDGWLAQVGPTASPLDPNDRIDAFPVKGVKAIIAPHAGYSYSGPPAAWAYGCIDTKSIKRVFVLGPSHHAYLDGCALTGCDEYETPIGSLAIDTETTAQLQKTGRFSTMSPQVDADEHSIEMHLPYIRKIFENQNIKIVPVLVGAISASKESQYGQILAPYLASPDTIFVVSSDFCHWGSRFSYTYYKAPGDAASTSLGRGSSPSSLSSFPIHASIEACDHDGMRHISLSPSSGSSTKTAAEAHAAFTDYIKQTKNTVCGRHPIGVLLGTVAELQKREEPGWAKEEVELKWTRYAQSSACTKVSDSSVSYASAYLKMGS